MPILETASLGALHYHETDIIQFPLGLPGFEEEKSFLAIERPESNPLLFLQSLRTPNLFFLTVPVEVVDSRYELRLLDEYRQVLDLPAGLVPGPSRDLQCLAILCFPEDGPPTANLLGPLVIHGARHKAVQAIRDDARYSAQQPLFEAQRAC